MKIRSFGRICLCLYFLLTAGCVAVPGGRVSHDHMWVRTYVEGPEVVTVKGAEVRVAHRDYVVPGRRIVRYDNPYNEPRSRPRNQPNRIIIYR